LMHRTRIAHCAQGTEHTYDGAGAAE
jgi:hypothetical protein